MGRGAQPSLEPVAIDVAKPATNVVPIPTSQPEANQVGLFDFMDVEQGESTPVQESVQEQPKPMTVGEMRAKMGMVAKAKKRRDMVGDDEVMLFAL